MTITYYWINIDSATKRKDKMLNEFKNNNITNHHRISACLPPENNKVKRMKENACCRSHLKALSTFLFNSNDEYALICEDDLTFEFKSMWQKTLEEVIQGAPKDWGIIQLATIIQNIEPKFKDRSLYFKWQEQKSSSCLAWLVHRKSAMEILTVFFKQYNILKIPTPDCFSGGIYNIMDHKTGYKTYTYKYPMFIYPDENDSQLENGLSLHIASKRQVKQYLQKYLN